MAGNDGHAERLRRVYEPGIRHQGMAGVDAQLPPSARLRQHSEDRDALCATDGERHGQLHPVLCQAGGHAGRQQAGSLHGLRLAGRGHGKDGNKRQADVAASHECHEKVQRLPLLSKEYDASTLNPLRGEINQNLNKENGELSLSE